MPMLLLCSLTALIYLLPNLGASQPLVQTGRYTAVLGVPTGEQQDPLRAIVTVEFSEDVETVGQAIHRMLSDTGYALSDVLYWDVEVFALLDYQLPEVHRTLGPLAVLDVLKVLLGPSFAVVIDPVHRKVAFELNEDLRALGFGQIERERH